MAKRIATKQLQYRAYGCGLQATWEAWGDYADTIKDQRMLNQDRRDMAGVQLTRVVYKGEKEWIS